MKTKVDVSDTYFFNRKQTIRAEVTHTVGIYAAWSLPSLSKSVLHIPLWFKNLESFLVSPEKWEAAPCSLASAPIGVSSLFQVE